MPGKQLYGEFFFLLEYQQVRVFSETKSKNSADWVIEIRTVRLKTGQLR